MAGRSYRVDLRGRDTGDGTLFDPYLRGIHDRDGNLVPGTADDDGGEGYNSRVTFTPAESGAYYLAAGAWSGRGTYTVAVTDTSPPPEPPPAELHATGLRVADAVAKEGDDAEIEFRVTLDSAATEPVTVDYATWGGTAVAGEDYEAASGTLTFAPGETEKTVRVTVIDDAVEDSGETFRLVLSNPSGAGLADAEAVGTILNAETLTVGGSSVAGRIISPRSDPTNPEVDWFEVELEAGRTYRIDQEGVATGRGTIDPWLRGISDNREQLSDLLPGTSNDDTHNSNSRVYFTPEEDGTYFIAASGTRKAGPHLEDWTGTYRDQYQGRDQFRGAGQHRHHRERCGRGGVRHRADRRAARPGLVRGHARGRPAVPDRPRGPAVQIRGGG